MKKIHFIVLTSFLVILSCKSALQSNNTENSEASKLELNNSKWRLIKLNGKAIEKNDDSKRDLGIIFTADGRFSAYVGCNSIAGSYEMNDETNRISFSKGATTMMACNDMLTEQEFGKVLEMTDNYNFDGKTLKLNKARMSYLAEFELIK